MSDINFPIAGECVLTAGRALAGIVPEMGLVSHFQVGNWPVLYRPLATGNVKRWGIPLMIPNFGRLKDGLFIEKGTQLPAHGFGRDLPWTVVEQEERKLSMQLTSNERTRAIYPYDFVFTACIVLDESSLTYGLTMENRGNESMPVAPGFHPYFTIAQQDKGRIVADGPDGFLAASIDWDTQPPDQSFPYPSRITVQMPEYGSLTIAEVPVNGQYTLSELQIWSEPATAPDHNFVCFEPVVASADGLNRPQDRLNIAPGSARTIMWQMVALPLSR